MRSSLPDGYDNFRGNRLLPSRSLLGQAGQIPYAAYLGGPFSRFLAVEVAACGGREQRLDLDDGVAGRREHRGREVGGGRGEVGNGYDQVRQPDPPGLVG